MWTRRSPLAGDHDERVHFPQLAPLLPIPDSTAAASAKAATTAPCVNGNNSWGEQTFAQLYSSSSDLGCVWPPRSYSCSFCGREFRSAQALGGHMNIHRRDRARLRALSPPPATVNICSTSNSVTPQAGDLLHQRYQRGYPNTLHEANVANPSNGHDYDGVLAVSTPPSEDIASQPSFSSLAIAAVASQQEQQQRKRSFSLMLRPLHVPDLKIRVNDANQRCQGGLSVKEREEYEEVEEVELQIGISSSKRNKSEGLSRDHPDVGVLPSLTSRDSVGCRQTPLRREIMLELGLRGTLEKLDLELRL